MSKINRRTQDLINLGLLPLSGEIKKHRKFVNGIPTSYLSVELNHFLPQDLEVVIQLLKSELESVEQEFKETVALLTS